MMLDLIISKCQEENFVTTLDSAQDMIGLHSKVRRLSLQFDEAKHGTLPAAINQSQARSLTIIRCSDYSHMLPLLKFRLLRVLDLDFGSNDVRKALELDLTGMCLLFQLRYFKIQLPWPWISLQLPTQIQGLQYLETFEIHLLIENHHEDTGIVIPTDIVHLPGLLHLIIPDRTRLPNGIGNMKSLHTLLGIDLNQNSLENIKGLGELTNLRSLRITYYRDGTKYVDVFSPSLGKMICRNLRYLQVICGCPFAFSWRDLRAFHDGLVCLSPSRSNLQDLDLYGWSFSRVPKWIGEIHNLNTLRLNVMELLKDDVGILAELPALITLDLHIRWAPKEGIIIYGTAFPVLMDFTFYCRTACLFFEAGAIPNLQRLHLSFCAREAEQCTPQLVGIEHLSGLREIDLEIRKRNISIMTSKIEAAEFALRNAINMHTSCPDVKIRLEPCTGCPFVDDEEYEEGQNCPLW